ncbi:MAG: Acetyltransferase (GNAT) family protein [candidate division WS6 bacterium OLB20]|uniref:Acetyltransferase (GNAT) family protein n=1 Tax=candidate division WS6 bacterium OLB20 TaxID=1617426 RepID=A0A136LXL3_9BACT|nr:MAG: Acetyltransferase (GNAT) family protein [candidate division WS6 bacterium OLB20]
MAQPTEIRINQTDDLSRALDLAETVFTPGEEDREQYHNRKDWEERIANGGLFLTAYSEGTFAGFALCTRKPGDRFHIWITCVDEEFRRKGIWRRLYENILDYALFSGYRTLTLNTNEQRFPEMYAFMRAEGYDITATEEQADGTVKTFFSKKLR